MDNMCKAKFANSGESQKSSLFGILKKGSRKLIGNIMSSSFKTQTANAVKEVLSGAASSDKFTWSALDGTAPARAMSSLQNVFGECFYCPSRSLISVFNVDGGSMLEYSELMQLSNRLKKQIVYFSFDRVDPDRLLCETLEQFSGKEAPNK